jgi:6-pyruvoyltetrahydropterin/6-carboxytetrahydropterin synthase
MNNTSKISEFSITKEFNWGMAHRLENHKGLCNNIHGHNYKMFVTFVSNNLSNGGSNDGMICDFKEIKEIINEIIVIPFDHSFVYNVNDKLNRDLVFNMLKIIPTLKLVPVNYRPTAENMCKDFLLKINKKLEEYDVEYYCKKVLIYETDTSFAEYTLV